VEKSPESSPIRNFVEPYIELSGNSRILITAEGWNNRIYQIGDKYMLKIPLIHKNEKQLELEVQISGFLQGRLSVPVPSFVHYGRMEDGNFAALYRRLDGVNITNKEYVRKEEHIKPEVLGEDEKLEFFRDISHISREIISIPEEQIPEAARKDGPALIEHYMDMLQAAREDVFRYIDRNTGIRIEEYFKDVLKPEVFNFTPCFIHGDLGGWNILYDLKTMKISGLLDWGNASLSDPALDYSELVYDYGNEFSFAFLKYMNESGMKPDPGFLNRSEFYVRISGIIDALYGIASGDGTYLKHGLNEIERLFGN
jgi:aminoglycoside 2''-phosphotransferase